MGGRVGWFVASATSEILKGVHDDDINGFLFVGIVSWVVSRKIKEFLGEGENRKKNGRQGRRFILSLRGCFCNDVSAKPYLLLPDKDAGN